LGFKTETDYRIQRNRLVRNHGLRNGRSNVLKTAESIPKNITVLHLDGNRAHRYVTQIGDIRMFYENDVRF
jgi:hypothetical protein